MDRPRKNKPARANPARRDPERTPPAADTEPAYSALAHPHDLLVRSILGEADLAADLLRNYLEPELVSALDLASLRREGGEAVSSDLSQLIGDLRFSARFTDSTEDLNVFVILEHQSRPDRLMRFRMLEYVVAAFRQHVPALRKGGRFPYPLAVVLHHGIRPWKRIPQMSELISLRPGVPNDILNLPICLIDVAAIPVDTLRGHPVVCALLDSLQGASTGRLPERAKGIFARLRGVAGDRRAKQWLTALTRYYSAVRGTVRNFRDELARAYAGLYDEQETGKMATSMLEQILLEGEARGIAKGEARGIAKGKAEGVAEGEAKGIAKGKAEGMTEGKAEAVAFVLEGRFGSAPVTVQRKIMNIRDSARLEQMLKLAATCHSLKEFQKAL